MRSSLFLGMGASGPEAVVVPGDGVKHGVHVAVAWLPAKAIIPPVPCHPPEGRGKIGAETQVSREPRGWCLAGWLTGARELSTRVHSCVGSTVTPDHISNATGVELHGQWELEG